MQYRKGYQPKPKVDDLPISTPPSANAIPASSQEAPPPPEPEAPKLEQGSAVETSPADEAAKAAIKEKLAAEHAPLRDRLMEMERAEQLAVQQQTPSPPPPEQVPAAVARWLNENPQYLQDPVANAELQLATRKAVRDGLHWDQDDFVPRVQHYLNGHATSAPARVEAPRPAPQRQAPARTVPVSAPPTREVPSYSTGRPQSDMRLTAEEHEIAAGLGLSDQEYGRQKLRMHRMKASGEIQS
jgi:hypothetical protein